MTKMVNRCGIDLKLFLLFGLSFAWFFYFATDYIVPGSSAVATAGFALGGILNPPGYPLFGIFSSIFKFVPFDSIALRANFMASVFGGLSVVLLFGIAKTWIREANPHLNRRDAMAFSSLAALLWMITPNAIGHFAHIEKYSVGIVFLFLAARVFSEYYFRTSVSKIQVLFFSLLSMISVISHYAYAPLVMLMGILLLFRHRPHFESRWILHFFFGVLAGATPLLYLPLASSFNPVLDWWSPDTVENFWQTLSRAQYRGSSIPLTWDFFIARLSWQYDFLWQQWRISPLVIVPLAFIFVVWKRPRILIGALVSLLFLLISGELVTARIRIFDPLRSLPSLTEGFQRYCWSFYLAWIAVIIVLMVILFSMVANQVSNSKLRSSLALLLIFVFVPVGIANRLSVGKYPAVLPEWISYIDQVTQPGDAILMNFDAIYFALLTSQQEGHFNKSKHLIHGSLSLMPWYHDSLAKQYPDWYPAISSVSRDLKSWGERSYADPMNRETGMRWIATLQPFVLSVLKNSNRLFVISNVNQMPLDMSVMGQFALQKGIVGSWAYEEATEVLPISWQKLKFPETFKGSIQEFPWLLAYREALRSQWSEIQTLQMALFPEDQAAMLEFAKQLDIESSESH